MDSKSISRKGVGVQVPASAPIPATDDPLFAAVMPVLLHRVSNTTQLLSAVNALVALDPGQDALRERADDIAWTSASMHADGWLLAVIASARGADLLLARREPDGLALVVKLVVDALRREGRDLEHGDRALPRLAPDVHRGWELSWAVAGWLWSAGRTRPARSALAWSVDLGADEHAITVVAERDASIADRMDRIRASLPEVQFEERGSKDALAMIVPSSWLAAAASER